eukprot:jgi/Bigna1/128093/aug1.5_g2801
MSNQKLKTLDERLGKITRIFSHFDGDNDGHWSLDEANAAAVATNGQPASAEDWTQLCQLLEANPSKGLSFDDVARTYLDKDVYTLLGTSPTQVEKDYDAVMDHIYAFVIQKFKKVITKDSEIEFKRKIQPFAFSAGEIIIKKGGLSPGLHVITKGSCRISSGESSSKVIKSGSILGGSCIRADPGMVNEENDGKKKKLSKAQKRNRKGKSEKIAKWLALKQCEGLFNAASTYEAKCVTDIKGYLVPAITVLRTAAIEEPFRVFLAQAKEEDDVDMKTKSGEIEQVKEKGGGISSELRKGEREEKDEEEVEEELEKIEGENEGEEEAPSFDFDPENVNFSWEAAANDATAAAAAAKEVQEEKGGVEEKEGSSSSKIIMMQNHQHHHQEQGQFLNTERRKNDKQEKEEEDAKSTTEHKRSPAPALACSSNSTSRDKATEDMVLPNVAAHILCLMVRYVNTNEMLRAVHSFFDNDGDGYWNAKEACAAQLVTEGTPMMEDEYVLICEMLGADSSKGLAIKDVWRLYLDPEFKATMGMSDEMIAEDTLGKDYSVVINAKKKKNKNKKKKKKRSGTRK